MPDEKDPHETTPLADGGTFQMDHLSDPLTIDPESIPDESWPRQNWDRYELVGMLGKGGMGRVFKAFDPRLKRHVALKFILGESPDLIRRFVREAQAQARVDHENVCKIFEVNQEGDKPYIAMQFVDGKTLNRLTNEMTLHEKVAVIRDVCEGIHAAHRLGLIHRDIKPGNIMVERREDGWHPYVMDFGLAKPMHSAEHTQIGLIMGTPAYMSPEQASGSRSLDRRSEVYSLGATLYAAVSGRPPFEGETPMEVLSNIASKDPQPIRHHDKSVPRELETIIFKCLEKEPGDRYDSARLLADDLQRFLDGEPIQAKPPTISYVLGKRIRKNPVSFAIAALGIVLSLAVGGFALQSRWTSQERAAAAQRFGQDVERIESILRYARMLPLHDVTREKNLARARMRQIAVEMARAGTFAAGPAEYAIGRGHLALNEYEPARDHLQKAWNAGYRAPEVSYAQGLTLTAIYQQELEHADKILSKKQRQEHINKLEAELRKPALQFLEQARNAQTDSPEFLSAVIAFQSNKYPEALRLSEQAFQRLPWLYEALRLQGDVYLRMAKDERDRGDFDSARRNYRNSEAAYGRAIRIAQSDAETYDQLSVCRLNMMTMELYYTQGNVEEAYPHVMESVGKSLQADPNHAMPFIRKSYAATALAEYRSNRGQDTADLEAQAIEAAKTAVRMEPGNKEAYSSRSFAYWQKATTLNLQGNDPRPSLEQAEADFQKALSFQPDDATYNDLGSEFRIAAEYENDHGVDPSPNIQRSIQAFESALALNPRNFISYNNLGISYDIQGLYDLQHGKDPSATLEKALQNYQKAMELSPDWLYPLSNQGNSYLYLAEYYQRTDRDPMPEIQKSMDCFRKAVELNPSHANFHSNVAGTATTAAAYQIRVRKDPENWLKQAEEAASKAAGINGKDYYFPFQLAQVDSLRARWALSNAQNPSAFLQQAADHIARSVKLGDGDPDVFAVSAENAWLAAEWNHRQKQAPQTDAGMRAAQRALELRPDHPRALAAKGALLLLKSNGKQGADLLQRALKLDPTLKEDFTIPSN